MPHSLLTTRKLSKRLIYIFNFSYIFLNPFLNIEKDQIKKKRICTDLFNLHSKNKILD